MKRLISLFALLLAVAGTGQNFNQPWLPDHKLTPGMINSDLTKDVICAKGWSTKSVRHTSGKVKHAIYAAYGITSHKPGEYEIDHLISLELGGADVPKNLWPEPYHGPYNAHIKDTLENELHKEVCSGKADLATVQQEISKDWVTCYKKHIGDPMKNKAWPQGVVH